MTRGKTKPTVQKPAFDEETVLRFVQDHNTVSPKGKQTPQGSTRESDGGRLPLTLMLKPEVITRLQEEAVRKEKSVGQVVEKLVIKQWGKH